MGSGIAHVLAQTGRNVLLYDVEDRLFERSLSGISRNMDRQIAKGTMTADQKDLAISRIRTTTTLPDLVSAGFVIEAVTENLDVKARIFSEVDQIVSPKSVLASNTSSISIGSIAAATRRPRMVIGMHFMNPVPVMQLVEVVRGKETSDWTVTQTMDLARQMGKIPVEVNDSPGFVSNRILIPMINEAAFCLLEGVATAEAIDSIMKLGMKHPLGPLALADLIGIDVCLNIMEVLQHSLDGNDGLDGNAVIARDAGLKRDKYRPCPLFQEMVERGHLGRKSGRGFHSY